MGNRFIPEEVEEAFVERYFNFEDDEETVKNNARKALSITKYAHKKAAEITAAAEDGELFDESEAILAFQTLALGKEYAEEFIQQIPEAEPFRKYLEEILA